MLKLTNFSQLIQKFSNLSLLSSSIRNDYKVLNFARSISLDSSYSSTSSFSSSTIPHPPKRSSNVFALFVRDCFKRMPLDMPVKEKFAQAGQEWRQLSPEQKDYYQKMGAEEFVKYKTAMDNYLKSLSPEQVDQFKQMKKDQIKLKSRQRIKMKLRELNYPKRGLSAYIFFIRDKKREDYPDGNYPPVRSLEHFKSVKKWSQQWHELTMQQRQPYNELAENDRKRYFYELEHWKMELAKPENEEKFKQLERLSKKMMVANLSPEKTKTRERKQRKIAAKIIRKRLMKNAAAEAKIKVKAKKRANQKQKSSLEKKIKTKQVAIDKD